jgi:uncharacterized membrane protein YbhN (UPF0104 family)
MGLNIFWIVMGIFCMIVSVVMMLIGFNGGMDSITGAFGWLSSFGFAAAMVADNAGKLDRAAQND